MLYIITFASHNSLHYIHTWHQLQYFCWHKFWDNPKGYTLEHGLQLHLHLYWTHLTFVSKTRQKTQSAVPNDVEGNENTKISLLTFRSQHHVDAIFSVAVVGQDRTSHRHTMLCHGTDFTMMMYAAWLLSGRVGGHIVWQRKDNEKSVWVVSKWRWSHQLQTAERVGNKALMFRLKDNDSQCSLLHRVSTLKGLLECTFLLITRWSSAQGSITPRLVNIPIPL